MFDKKKYRERREAGLRGQEYPEPVFYPKGTKVFKTDAKGKPVMVVNKEGKKVQAEHPNDGGHHSILGTNVLVNRKVIRSKVRPPKRNKAAEKLRRDQRAVKHARRNAGEHERALKLKEAKMGGMA